jgi:predicted transcriptional regulator
MTRAGRPRGSYGEVTRAVLTSLEAQPMTTRRLAHELQATPELVQKAVSRLRDAGMVQVVGSEPAPHRGDVQVYGITPAHVIALEWPRF